MISNNLDEYFCDTRNQEESRIRECQFCGGYKVALVYMDCDTQETIEIDTDEELEDNSIYAYIHCYECDIDFCADTMLKPKEVIKKWNCRSCSEKVVSLIEEQKELLEAVEDTRKEIEETFRQEYRNNDNS